MENCLNWSGRVRNEFSSVTLGVTNENNLVLVIVVPIILVSAAYPADASKRLARTGVILMSVSLGSERQRTRRVLAANTTFPTTGKL